MRKFFQGKIWKKRSFMGVFCLLCLVFFGLFSNVHAQGVTVRHLEATDATHNPNRLDLFVRHFFSFGPGGPGVLTHEKYEADISQLLDGVDVDFIKINNTLKMLSDVAGDFNPPDNGGSDTEIEDLGGPVFANGGAQIVHDPINEVLNFGEYNFMSWDFKVPLVTTDRKIVESQLNAFFSGGNIFDVGINRDIIHRPGLDVDISVTNLRTNQTGKNNVVVEAGDPLRFIVDVENQFSGRAALLDVDLDLTNAAVTDNQVHNLAVSQSMQGNPAIVALDPDFNPEASDLSNEEQFTFDTTASQNGTIEAIARIRSFFKASAKTPADDNTANWLCDNNCQSIDQLNLNIDNNNNNEVDLSLVKTADRNVVQTDENVTYTLVIRNIGIEDATGVTVVDDFDENALTIVNNGGGIVAGGQLTFTIGDLDVGDEETLTYIARTQNGLADGTDIDNTATVNSIEADSNLANNTDTETVEIQGAFVDVVITKVANFQQVAAGDSVEYTLTIENQGTQDATGVTVVDDFDETRVDIQNPGGGIEAGGTLTFAIGDLDAGEEVTRVYTVETDSNLAVGTDIENTAVVNSIEADANEANNTAEEEVEIVDVFVDLEVTKQASLTTVEPGDVFTYTLRVENNGTQNATDVELEDTFDNTRLDLEDANGGTVNGNRITFDIGDLDVGESATRSFSVKVRDNNKDGDTITNVVVADSFEPDANEADNTDDIDVKVDIDDDDDKNGGGGGGKLFNERVNVAIEKRVSLNGRDYFDADTVEDALIAVAGDRIVLHYEVEVFNDSRIGISRVKIGEEFLNADAWDAGLLFNIDGANYDEVEHVFTLFSIAPGTSRLFDFNVEVRVPDEPIPLGNVVEYLESSFADRSGITQRHRPSFPVLDKAYVINGIIVEPSPPQIFDPCADNADVKLSKFVSKDLVYPGDIVTIRLVADNISCLDLTDLVVTDDYDERYLEVVNTGGGTDTGSDVFWELPVFREGGRVEFIYELRVLDTAREGIPMETVATIFVNELDLSFIRIVASLYTTGPKQYLLQTGFGNQSIFLGIVLFLGWKVYRYYKRKTLVF